MSILGSGDVDVRLRIDIVKGKEKIRKIHFLSEEKQIIL